MASISVQYSEDRGSSPRPASSNKKVFFRRIVSIFLCVSFLFLAVPVQAAFVVDDAVVLGSLVFTLAVFGVSIKAVDLLNSSDLVGAFDDLFARADVPFSWENQRVSIAAPGTLKVGKEIVSAAQNLASWIRGELQDGSSSLSLVSPSSGFGFVSDSGLPISFGTPHVFPSSYGNNSFLWDNVGTLIPYESFQNGIDLNFGQGGLEYHLKSNNSYEITSPSRQYILGFVSPGQTCCFFCFSLAGSDNLYLTCFGRDERFLGRDIQTTGSLSLISSSALNVDVSELSSFGLVADVSPSSFSVDDSDLFVATPSSFLTTEQMVSDALSVASATDVPVSAVGSTSLDDVLNVQVQLLEGVTSIQAALSVPDPMESPDFQAHPLADIWHYVIDWLNSVEDFLVLYATIFNGLPYIIRLPFYAAVVLFLYAGIIRKLVGV